MNFQLLNPRNRIWPWLGWGVLGGTVLGTAGFFIHRPKAIRAGTGGEAFEGRGMGRFGRVVEQLDRSTFTLEYDTIRGDDRELQAEGIRGLVAEEQVHWKLVCPQATRTGSTWLLYGPLTVEAREARSQRLVGKGRMERSGPVLQWEKGVWQGLGDMVWEDLEGQGRGRWDLPAGWRRGLDGRFNVDRGPVRWEALPGNALKGMTAQKMSVLLGLDDALLEGVQSRLEGGEVDTARAIMDAKDMRWEAPIRFRRDDGWRGEAASGWAPRPLPGETLRRMEFKDVTAHRDVPLGEERLRAGGTRWTPEGLRVEGDVRWTMPAEGGGKESQMLELRTPRLLLRSAPGQEDLPESLPIGDAWAEGTAVLIWGARSLSSPRLEARKVDRSWVVNAPSYGKAEQGTFSAGRGHGKPGRWEFEGPVTAQLVRGGGSVRGGKLVWENEVWTFSGRPVTYTSARERLSGPRMVRKGDQVLFPDGLSGALMSPEGDLTVRADQGERRTNAMELLGRVGCVATGWRLDADRVQVSLGAGQAVERVEATGHVALTGNMGEGQGHRLVLDLQARKVWWEGRVRGTSEVRQ